MKTKEQIKKEIEQKQQELDLLQKELESIKDLKEAWKEEYDNETEKMTHKTNWDITFHDEKSAKLWEEQDNLFQELQTFAKLRNGDWVADWGNENDIKIGLSLLGNKCLVEDFYIGNGYVYGISFKNEEIAQEALEIFGERIEQLYGK